MSGGAGNDVLFGGAGTDTFVFESGRDTISAFEDNLDTILIDRALVNPGMTAEEVIDTHAWVVDGAVVFEFGYGNVLTVQGVSSPNALRDDLVIV